jgi:cell division protein FtsB
MGYGSAGTPPWVDEKRVEEEEQKQKNAEVLTKLRALERENKALKKRVTDLEAEVKRLKK